MPEPVDPFAALHRPVEPIEPSRAFTAELRGRIERALGRSLGPAARLAYLPEGFTALTPYLAVRDARAAMAFYEEVFEAVVEGEPIIMDDGRVGHAQLRIGDAVLFMADEFPEIGVVSPEGQEGSSMSLVVYVPDVDAAFERAVARGATVERTVEDGQHGSRAGWFRDPFGHRWNVGTPQDLPARPLRTDTVELGVRAPFPGSDPVQLGYYTLGSTDVAASRGFFEELFGWELVGPPEEGAHITNSRPPGGIGPDPDGPSTTAHFRVPDVEVYARRVRELGGTTEPTAEWPSGRGVRCHDTTGLPFELWEPAEGY
jgi:uncharacterized glyoxalase superfamily protein PhnB